MAIADYLQKLVELKKQLAANLRSMGVVAGDSEKLNTLVPKVLDIETGVDTSDATATAEDIAVGKTAYVAGGKITGTKEEAVQNVEWVNKTGFEIMGEVIGTAKSYNNLSNLMQTITIPDCVTSIGDYAFDYCSNLVSVIIPDSVTSIKMAAFAYCTNLAHIYYTGTEEQWNAITKGSSWYYQMGSNVEGGTVIHYNYVP